MQFNVTKRIVQRYHIVLSFKFESNAMPIYDSNKHRKNSFELRTSQEVGLWWRQLILYLRRVGASVVREKHLSRITIELYFLMTRPPTHSKILLPFLTKSLTNKLTDKVSGCYWINPKNLIISMKIIAKLIATKSLILKYIYNTIFKKITLSSWE